MMMVFRWECDKKNFLKAFDGYLPPEVVDTQMIAREKGLPIKWDDICASVTGGPLSSGLFVIAPRAHASHLITSWNTGSCEKSATLSLWRRAIESVRRGA